MQAPRQAAVRSEGRAANGARMCLLGWLAAAAGVADGGGSVIACLQERRADIGGQMCRRQVLRLLGIVVEDHRADEELMKVSRGGRQAGRDPGGGRGGCIATDLPIEAHAWRLPAFPSDTLRWHAGQPADRLLAFAAMLTRSCCCCCRRRRC